MKAFFSLAVVTLLTIGASHAQKIKIVQGDLKNLKGVKSLNTEFSYSPMVIGKDEDEQAYIDEKKSKYNEKEPGRGEKWEKAWFDDRKNLFEPQFRELFAKHSGLSTTDESSPYKMIFRTTRTEPGFNVGVMRRPAFIDAEVLIVEAANPDKIIARIEIKNSPGRDAWGVDFETGARLQEAYAKAGKSLGKFIADKTR